MKNYIPKVGDKVRITKGHTNWVDSMDKYVGNTYTINKVDGNSRTPYVEFAAASKEEEENSLLFGINSYGWFYHQGHFEPIQQAITTFKFC